MLSYLILTSANKLIFYPSCSTTDEFLLRRYIKIPNPTTNDKTPIDVPPIAIGKMSSSASTIINPIKILNALDGNKAEILL